MKIVDDILKKIKGEAKVSDVLTDKGSFSKQNFGEIVNALANDTTFKIKTYKNGKETGEVNISELLRADLKKSVEMAGYPGKTEKAIFDTCKITTTGLTEAFGHILNTQLGTGKKYDLPATSNMTGSLYLAAVPGKTTTHQIQNFKTKEKTGETSTITTQASVQLRAKSPVPKHLQTKVRRDKNGIIITG